ncbi:MAG: hypothetical protein KAS32_00220 [Candidatus Peribacteraceae bacterium]|nr:hypothetical protein [Candidatus Peribacteraceae bacterium]
MSKEDITTREKLHKIIDYGLDSMDVDTLKFLAEYFNSQLILAKSLKNHE